MILSSDSLCLRGGSVDSRSMAFVPAAAPLLRPSWDTPCSPARPPRVSAARQPPRCRMDDGARTSERSYLLGEPPQAVDELPPPPPPDTPPPTGIVQTTRDLDGRVLFGEWLSTFLFVYLSVHAAALGAPLANALNNAAVIAAVAASFMPVSGAHLNPAVTLALLVTNRVSLRRAAAFVPLQLAASAAACYMARALGTPMAFGGIAAAASTTDVVRAFFAELMPMFIIVIVVFQTAVATEKEGGVGNKIAALYIGLAVLACAGTFTTGVFNPARAFGPALVAGNFVSHWVFWIGPCVGASLAAFVRCSRLADCAELSTATPSVSSANVNIILSIALWNR